ncbi:MAG: site-specific integrase [Polyangiaceae bacterium]|jgi:site-specific recombinase XerD|nr:site-specific integrase [Polyangiaceae bacterium]
MTAPSVGALVHAFFVEHLVALKGLRPSSVRSYRDTMRLFLGFVAADAGRAITRLTPEDLSFERVLAFLRHLEEGRGNHARTRNQRLAALRTFFAFVGTRSPERLDACERVAAIPRKRAAPPATTFLERDEVDALLARVPAQGRHALRDRVLLLFLYNTGARAQEAADLRFGDVDLGPHPRVRLHGKGDKWRTCPLWAVTAQGLTALRAQAGAAADVAAPVFAARPGRALTRFGLYKLVRRHAAAIDATRPPSGRRISPHVFRHTTAVHLLEAGVDMNVIRGWLGHAQVTTTYRYAEINTRAKEAALRACEPPQSAAEFGRAPAWRSDQALLAWLTSL